MINTELPKLNEFLKGLQKNWEQAKISMEIAKEVLKKQFDKKRRNPQGLKVRENMWLKAKNIHSNRLSKKLD